MANSGFGTGRHGTTSICPACDEVFCGLKPFEAHRVGLFLDARSGPIKRGRRCLTVAQMEAAGFAKCAADRWSAP
jgi:hypothetical protein